MTRTFKRIIAAAIIFILIAAGAVALVMTGGCSSNAIGTGPLDNMRNGAVNALIDISGIKGRADSELREHAGVLASELSIPQSLADSIIDSLAIEDWRATSLPAGAQETSVNTVSIKNVPTTIKTYDDPSVVTIGAYGIDVTLEIPESARTYTSLLGYLKYVI